MPNREQLPMPLEELEANLKDYIDNRDAATEQKIKLWVMGAVLAQIAVWIPVVFFIGGIYQSVLASNEQVKVSQKELATYAVWMNDREKWEQAIEQWAEPKGFKPPHRKELPIP